MHLLIFRADRIPLSSILLFKISDKTRRKAWKFAQAEPFRANNYVYRIFRPPLASQPLSFFFLLFHSLSALFFFYDVVISVSRRLSISLSADAELWACFLLNRFFCFSFAVVVQATTTAYTCCAKLSAPVCLYILRLLILFLVRRDEKNTRHPRRTCGFEFPFARNHFA